MYIHLHKVKKSMLQEIIETWTVGYISKSGVAVGVRVVGLENLHLSVRQHTLRHTVTALKAHQIT